MCWLRVWKNADKVRFVNHKYNVFDLFHHRIFSIECQSFQEFFMKFHGWIPFWIETRHWNKPRHRDLQLFENFVIARAEWQKAENFQNFLRFKAQAFHFVTKTTQPKWIFLFPTKCDFSTSLMIWQRCRL